MSDDESSDMPKSLMVIGKLVITSVTLLLFLILIVILCATFIVQLYEIDDGTDHLKHVEDGTDRIVYVEEGIDLLHVDIQQMISTLNLWINILISMDENIANICNGQSCSSFDPNYYQTFDEIRLGVVEYSKIINQIAYLQNIKV